MKKLFTILGLLTLFCISNRGYSQIKQYIGTPNSEVNIRGRLSVDSVLILPYKDTSDVGSPIKEGSVIYQRSDKSIYYYDGFFWEKVMNYREAQSIIQNGVDTTSLSSRIDKKLDISDTTNKWLPSTTKIPDSSISADWGIVKYIVNNVIHLYADSSLLATPYAVQDSIQNNKIDTFYLSNRIDKKLNISDTTNKWLSKGATITINGIKKILGTNPEFTVSGGGGGTDTISYAKSPITKTISGNTITFGGDTSILATNYALKDSLKNKLIIDTTLDAEPLHDIKGTGDVEVTDGENTIINKDASIDLTSDAKSKLSDGETAYGWGDHSTQGYLKNITGLLIGGSNISMTGDGTISSPYEISSSGVSNTNLANTDLTQESGVDRKYQIGSGTLTFRHANGDSVFFPSNGNLVVSQQLFAKGIVAVPNSTSQINGSITFNSSVNLNINAEVDANYTVQDDDLVIFTHQTSGITITLPTSTDQGRILIIRNMGTGDLTMANIASGEPSTVSEGSSLKIIYSTDGEWYEIP